MKRLVAAALLIAALVSLAGVASAQDQLKEYPLFSKERLSFGARVEYAWWQQGGDSPLVLPFRKEFGFGVPVAYALTAKHYPPSAEYPNGHDGPPTLSLTARAIYFVDSRVTNYAIGLNLGLYDGGH